MSWPITKFLSLLTLVAGLQATESFSSRPNILIVISDDQSWPHAGAYGDRTVETPAFDRIAEQGVLFTHAFCPASQCSPSRAALLTGLNIWQLAEAGTHASLFPLRFTAYTDIRSDMLDYKLEIDWFDQQLAKCLDILDDTGEKDNTLIIVTSDNGMPFPRAKATVPESDSTRKSLANKLEDLLLEQGDPRSLGKGDVFESYPYYQRLPEKGFPGFMEYGVYNLRFAEPETD